MLQVFFFLIFYFLGSTFMKTNLAFLLGYNLSGFVNSLNNRNRLSAHRSALLRRFLLNNSHMQRFAKAPKIQ